LSIIDELKRRNVIRVAVAYVVIAWLAVQVVETVFPAFGFGDAALRFIVIALAAAFVPVLVLAWVFEWTSEGFRKDADVDRSLAESARTGKKFDLGVMAILALAVGFFVFDKFILDPARDAAQLENARQEGRTEASIEAYGAKSIAVIPFLNLSSDPEQAFFADGVAEEVLNLLAKIPELRVISRSSSFTFRGEELEISEIARRLNVAHILEGSVRKAGDRIRVTAQLIEARSDTHLWSETYDRTLNDIFAIQDEIARHIVENLQVELVGPMPTATRTDPVALALTIQAKQIFNRFYTNNEAPGAEDARERYLLIGGGGYFHYGVIKLLQGDAEAALAIFEDLTKTDEINGPAGRAMALHSLGRYDESDAALEALIGTREGDDPELISYSTGSIAPVYAWRGERDSAFEWLDVALDDPYDTDNKVSDINRLHNPLFRSLHDDPRWEAFRERSGLPTRRIEAIEFSVELPK
jgi:TolB-like protein